MTTNKLKKYLIIAGILGALSVIFYTIYCYFFPLTVILSNYPDTELAIDGQGLVYTPFQKRLKYGKYAIEAKKEGYQAQNITIEIKPLKKNTIYINMKLKSLTKEELAKLSDIERQEYEALSDQSADYNESSLRSNQPLVALLPYTDPAMRFRIDYSGRVFETKYTVTLYGKSESELEESKSLAQKWILNQKINPKNLSITYIESKDNYYSSNYLE